MSVYYPALTASPPSTSGSGLGALIRIRLSCLLSSGTMSISPWISLRSMSRNVSAPYFFGHIHNLIGSVINAEWSCAASEQFSLAGMYGFQLDGFHGFFCNNHGIFSGAVLTDSHDVLAIGILFHSTDSPFRREYHVHSALKVLMTPWSRVSIRDTVFWGK